MHVSDGKSFTYLVAWTSRLLRGNVISTVDRCHSAVITEKALMVVRLIYFYNLLISAPTVPIAGPAIFSLPQRTQNRSLQLPSKRGPTRLVASSLARPQRPPPPAATPFWPDSWSSGVPAARRHQAHSKKSAQLRADEGQFSLFKNKARSDTTSL